MKNKRKPKGYWTKERCIEEALKYKTRTIFQHISKSAYDASFRNKWLDECCEHMEILGNNYKRAIYGIFFDDKSVYVGLSFNPKKRFQNHLINNQSSVYKHIKITGLNPDFKILTDFLHKDLASKKEGFFVRKFNKEGWLILNKSETGNLGGGTTKWTKECCHQEALKYKSKYEFKLKHPSAYKASLNGKWINDITTHMTCGIKPINFWNNKENCLLEAKKYEYRSEFKSNNSPAYKACCKNKWLNECCGHMSIKKRNTCNIIPNLTFNKT